MKIINTGFVSWNANKSELTVPLEYLYDLVLSADAGDFKESGKQLNDYISECLVENLQEYCDIAEIDIDDVEFININGLVL